MYSKTFGLATLPLGSVGRRGVTKPTTELPVVHALAASTLASGSTLLGICESLYPICRSITGDGVRETLGRLKQIIDLSIVEVPSQTPVFDWTVPQEWNLRRAYIEGPDGSRVVDSIDHNLHVVGYSSPVDARLTLEELNQHLYSLPETPDLIPYRTSYFDDSWGFCLTDKVRRSLVEGDYRVVIDAEIKDGSLTYGEFFIPGTTDGEFLISTHICHPSLANDNLSGISVALYLAKHFAALPPQRYGMRFLFVPGTIGAITWLALNQDKLPLNRGGVVLSGVGDRGTHTYKKSRRGDGIFDRLFARRMEAEAGEVRSFIPYGYDERQYCSPGINLAMGCLMRTPYSEYPEYHSSGDNLSLLSAQSLEATLRLCVDIVAEAQCEATYVSRNQQCEPQLGRRGLYDQLGGDNQAKELQLALLWMLSYSDGAHSLLDIHELSAVPVELLNRAAGLLANADLLDEAAQ